MMGPNLGKVGEFLRLAVTLILSSCLSRHLSVRTKWFWALSKLEAGTFCFRTDRFAFFGLCSSSFSLSYFFFNALFCLCYEIHRCSVLYYMYSGYNMISWQGNLDRNDMLQWRFNQGLFTRFLLVSITLPNRSKQIRFRYFASESRQTFQGVKLNSP